MTTSREIFTIAAVVLGTMLTRFLPFLIFPRGRSPGLYYISGNRLPMR